MKTTDGRGDDVILCFLGRNYTPRSINVLVPFTEDSVSLGLQCRKDVSFDLKALMNKWGNDILQTFETAS